MSRPPTLGAWPEDGGISFRIWAPEAEWVDAVVEGNDRSVSLEKMPDGTFEGWSADFKPGDLYRLRVDGEGPFPDPASRHQPEGVHGPSEVVDPAAFAWTDADWPGIDRDDLSIYELHIGTFTPEGTFEAATRHLEDLVDLGVTAVEILPVNDFPGRRNWGYDGVALFAPARCYGTPDDLRRLVDRAHALGLAVFLDVVYNHFGPEGNYTGKFSPGYVTPAHRTHWGPAINLGGEGSAQVREFFFENARMWLREYHFDGFRLDATHAFIDDGPRPFLAEFAEQARVAVDRPVVLIAEDHRNLDKILRTPDDGGWGARRRLVRRLPPRDPPLPDWRRRRRLHGLPRDPRRPRHHDQPRLALHRRVFGLPREGPGVRPRRHPPPTVRLLPPEPRPRRQPGAGRPPECRSRSRDLPGEHRRPARLAADADAVHGPGVGREHPFFYFTDHEPELGRAVREGRAREFRKYADFADPDNFARIPDPQAETTFLASKLIRDERTGPVHAGSLELHKALLRLRRSDPSFREGSHEATPLGEDVLAIRRGIGSDAEVLVVIRFKGAGPVAVDRAWIGEGREPEVVLTTEDPAFATDPEPIRLDLAATLPQIDFARPGAVILRKLPAVGV